MDHLDHSDHQVTNSQITGFDFTLNAQLGLPEMVIEFLNELKCTKWVFQQESGEETGYSHYQGRLRLKEKKRFNTVVGYFNDYWGKGWGHLSPTSTGTFKKKQGAFNYVMKTFTRVAGPWSNLSQKTDKEKEEEFIKTLPDDLQPTPKWRPFQQTIINMISKKPDDRTINVVFSAKGHQGRSWMAKWLDSRKLAIKLPPLRDAKEIVHVAMAQLKEGIENGQKQFCFFVDLPKACNQHKLGELFTALEILKGGDAFETRYKWSKLMFNPPHIWLFTNIIPDPKYLSADRWKIWFVNTNQELCDYYSQKVHHEPEDTPDLPSKSIDAINRSLDLALENMMALALPEGTKWPDVNWQVAQGELASPTPAPFDRTVVRSETPIV